MISSASTRALGGDAERIAAASASIEGPAPSTSIVTPPAVLPTHPASRSAVACRWINGLKPTPCTTPRTTIRFRAGPSIPASAMARSAFNLDAFQ